MQRSSTSGSRLGWTGWEGAFRHFGGVLREILLDHPKALVVRHDPQTREVAFNERFQQFDLVRIAPPDQNQVFRSLEIAPELIEAHGYLELTPELKAKVFCLNGARVSNVKMPEQRRQTDVELIGEQGDVPQAGGADLRDLRAEDRPPIQGAPRRSRRRADLSGP